MGNNPLGLSLEASELGSAAIPIDAHSLFLTNFCILFGHWKVYKWLTNFRILLRIGVNENSFVHPYSKGSYTPIRKGPICLYPSSLSFNRHATLLHPTHFETRH